MLLTWRENKISCLYRESERELMLCRDYWTWRGDEGSWTFCTRLSQSFFFLFPFRNSFF